MSLNVKNLSFSYDRKNKVFEFVNFSVEKGQVLCILGPNGSGKSTLLRCVNSLLKAESGSVTVNGKNLSAISRKELSKQIGFLPQIHVSTFPFSVLEVAVMGRSPHLGLAESPSDKDYQIAKDHLELLGISHLADKPYTHISGGERQLALIAMVLTQQPHILMLDEPTSHLDFGNQLRMLELVKRLSENGLTVVLTTHFPDHAFHLSSKVAIMHEKTVMATGGCDEVISEATLKSIYGIDVKIAFFDSSKVCVPIKK